MARKIKGKLRISLPTLDHMQNTPLSATLSCLCRSQYTLYI
nr:MAG TPA: hypothetical protein [Caudoviricetes sp.]